MATDRLQEPLTSLQDPSVLLLSGLTGNFRSSLYSPAPGLAFAVSLMTIRVPQCELSAAGTAVLPAISSGSGSGRS